MSDESDSSREKSSKKRTRKRKKKYKCTICKEIFSSKSAITSHTQKCCKKKRIWKCNWCNLEFTNRGNLSVHSFHIHGDRSYKLPNTKDRITCEGCLQRFSDCYKLREHVRRNHFNLKAKLPYADMKKVNQVWFEKVLNTNNIMEIKKTGNNKLIMKKMADSTSIKVQEQQTRVIDLSLLYPTDRRKQTMVLCEYCDQMYIQRDYKKHVDERHLNITKHHCNNCNRNFKRSYLYLKHHCNKAVKLKGVRRGNTELGRISNVESLSVPFIVM